MWCGPELGISHRGMSDGHRILPWPKVADVRMTMDNDVTIMQKGEKKAWKHVPASKVANPWVFRALLNHVLGSRPPGERPDTTTISTTLGAAPGTIGNLSARIGCDVRELLMDGYDLREVYGIARGEYTLYELLRKGPSKPNKRERRQR